MKIEHIYNDLRMLELSLRDRVGWYRRRAVKAKENNNLRKSDKLDAMARVYEAAWLSLAPICAELFNHTPKSYRKRKREENEMKLNDERRKVLTKYLGLCWHEGRMPINCGYRCVKCGDTYVVNCTFDTDADMIALFRKMVNKHEWDSFLFWTCDHYPTYNPPMPRLFMEPERFCWLVSEWLMKEEKKC